MSNIKFKLNGAGVRELLKSAEVENVCMEHARQVQGRAGEHYATGARHYQKRAGAAIYPNDAVGNNDNLKNNTLLRSLK